MKPLPAVALVLLIVLAGCGGGPAVDTPENERQRAVIDAMIDVSEYRAGGTMTVSARSTDERLRMDQRFRRQSDRDALRSCQVGRQRLVAGDEVVRAATAGYVENESIDTLVSGPDEVHRSTTASSIADFWAEETLYGRHVNVLQRATLVDTVDAGPGRTTLVVHPNETWMAEQLAEGINRPLPVGPHHNVSVEDARYRYTVDDATDRPVRITAEFTYSTDDLSARTAAAFEFDYGNVTVPNFRTVDDGEGVPDTYPSERCTEVVDRPGPPVEAPFETNMTAWADRYWGGPSEELDGVVAPRNGTSAAGAR